MKLKIIIYLLIQYFRINSVLGELTEGSQYHANVFGISKEHKNVFASFSVNINSKNNEIKPGQTLKSSKSFTDHKNAWTLWFQEEHGIQDENWPIVEAVESPVMQPQENDILQQYSELPTLDVDQIEIDRKNQTSDTDNIECQKSITEASCQKICSGDLIFEDNFNTINWTTWHPEIRIAMYDLLDNEFVSYQNRSENCYVNEGELIILPTLLTETGFSYKSIRDGTLDLRSECTAFRKEECYHKAGSFQILPPVVSARMRTKRSFDFRFGRVEVRAKLPKGDWLFPLILLEPSENMYGYNKYTSGQMRVAFARGNHHLLDLQGRAINQLLGGAIVSAGAVFRDIWLQDRMRMDHIADKFHIYTLTWTDQYISLEVDGSEYAKFPGQFILMDKTHQLSHALLWHEGEYMAPFDRKFFITLGVAAGGHADFPDGSKNAISTHKKPWKNNDPKAALHFWHARELWSKTWKGSDSGLRVDYVRVYAI